MSKELYFLRSSEQKIVVDMFKFAHPKTPDELLKYSEFYGLSSKDLGLYALVNGEIAGAVWVRKFEGDVSATLSLGVLEKFCEQEIESFMMEQFLQECAAVFDSLRVDVSSKDEATKELFVAFGFTQTPQTDVLMKTLEKKELVRPSDGYDPRKWMD